MSDGDADGAIEDIRRGIDAWLATGSRTYHTYYLGLLADALQRRGRHAEAVAPLEEALSAAKSLPEGLYEAELHRLTGRSLAHAGRGDEAEAAFARAVLLARAQGARWFESLAAADLASVRGRPGGDGERSKVRSRNRQATAARRRGSAISPAEQ
jgi:tetratricopeptide (TPR) repeat protein